MVCSKCEEDKPNDEFPNRGRICRSCLALATKAWKQANPEKALAQRARWRARRKEQAVYRTKTGKVLSDDDLQALADEAEEGYPIHRQIPDLYNDD